MSTQAVIEQLEIPIKLSFPVLCVNTFELTRAESVFEDVAARVGKHFERMPFNKVPSPPAIEELVKKASKEGKKGLVIFDPFFFDRQKTNPDNIPALKTSLVLLENEGVNYVVAGRDSLSEEFVYHINLPPMETQEIIDLLTTCETFIRSSGDIFTAEERKVLANHARGLSHSQMKNVFTLCAYRKFKELDYLPEIRREKAHLLQDVGLGVLDPIPLDDVGGLENLKEFLMIRKAGWEKSLPVKGVLLAGVPGGGKTLTAKACAHVFGTTLIRLDMGRFYNRYLGETERQFSRALQTIDQIAPVVVLIDEIEKFFGQSEGEHEVSKRLLGTFLYWLQERKEKIFIVATANRVSALPPELMRSGRWDRAFFIDLPTEAERRRIFEIHLKKVGILPESTDFDALVGASFGHTGAEIEQAVIDAQYLANAEDKPIDSAILLDAVSRITPTSETRKADIDVIRNLKNQGFYPANVFEEESKGHAGRRISVV